MIDGPNERNQASSVGATFDSLPLTLFIPLSSWLVKSRDLFYCRGDRSLSSHLFAEATKKEATSLRPLRYRPYILLVVTLFKTFQSSSHIVIIPCGIIELLKAKIYVSHTSGLFAMAIYKDC